MNPVAQFPYVYFLGIGGIGMSALARWFRANGHIVWGYDKTRTPLTEALQHEGIHVHYNDDPLSIPTEVRVNPDKTLVILTPAMPKNHQEWAWLRENNFNIQKRSQVLGLLTQGRRTVAVAGTHGKTTTSSMVAHLLHYAQVPAGAFLGGISVNLDSNLLLPPAQAGPEVPVVVEADEYDRSFLTLHPDVAIVTSTDADHLDIYGEQSALVESFRQFVSQIKPGGTLLLNHTADQSLSTAVQPGVRVLRYGLTPEQGPDLHTGHIQAQGHKFHFDLLAPGLGDVSVPGLELPVPGYHNVENLLAASAAASMVGLPWGKLPEAVAAYRGVHRRFEFVLTKGEEHAFIDDYAHHPREIEALLRSVRALYPGKRIRAVFQPHLYTRTRDFADGFAQSLSLADEVILLPIYPARELPIEGVESDIIFEKLTTARKALLSKERLLQVESAYGDDDFEVLATIGAGDIDQLVPELKKILKKKWYGAEA
ncbi:UDP-N-acetylmuramate--L-alanine ligase [Solirubrum puertoriconensis]|uniref:UDP-N-acetylmuramate--L-alanine ligase n=1 Tax=Solirubrum puertoriconensis TaxID=1751427 RepID=A0A9X0HPD3_SOLP1|nr:UDP-N-acetylmuramate--L-alanine ligase [Solirubrum puertoriconensis]KUG09776.1 UDP-N-acetylmuramate--alanine ligase [Solirubrum puertoriconensis]